MAALKKRRTFRKFTFRGVDLDQLLDMSYEQLMGLVHARARRRFSRGECVCVVCVLCVCVGVWVCVRVCVRDSIECRVFIAGSI